MPFLTKVEYDFGEEKNNDVLYFEKCLSGNGWQIVIGSGLIYISNATANHKFHYLGGFFIYFFDLVGWDNNELTR